MDLKKHHRRPQIGIPWIPICGVVIRYVWLVDISPTANIDRRDVVGKSSKSADHAGENTLGRAIGFVDTTAYGTGATGVPGIYQDDRDARPFRFVLDKIAELEERPTMQCGALAATNRNPRADALQVFESNRPLCVFRLRHKLLTDAVVGVLREAAFFTRQLLEFAFGRPRAFGLQFGSQAAVSMTHVVDVVSRVDCAIAIYSDVRHPQRAFHINRFGFFHFTGCRKEEHPPIDPQIAFTLASLEQFSLSFPTDKWDAQSTVHRPNRDGAILHPPRQDAVIVGDASSPFESAFRLAVKFVGVCDFSNGSHRNLGRQVELLPNIFVAGVVQIVLPKGFCLPSIIADALTGGIRLLNRLPEGVGLFACGEQFDLGNQSHALDCNTNVLYFQDLKLFLLAFFDVAFDGLGRKCRKRSLRR